MSNITKTGGNALQHLKPSMSLMTLKDLQGLKIKDPNILETLKAQMEPRIHNVLPKDLEETVSRILILSMERLGQKNLEPERALVIEQDFLKYLKSRFFNWSLQEVELACRMGALGELGEIQRHLTSQVLIQWLNEFDKRIRSKASRALNQAVSELNRIKEEGMVQEASKMSIEAKIEFVEDCFDKWLQDDSVPGSIVFKILEDLKWVNYSTAKKWEMIRVSVDDLMIKNKALLDNPALRMDAKDRIEQLKGVEIGKPKTVPDFLKVQSQRLGMELFFKDCQEMDMRPKELSEVSQDKEEPIDTSKGSPLNQVSFNQHKS